MIKKEINAYFETPMKLFWFVLVELCKSKTMEAVNFNKDALEKWWALLKNLNHETKIELASRLIDSLKSPNKPEEEKEDLRTLYGAWADENESAEELIEFLRKSRSTNRQIESFD